jgi:hypothetical protein
VKVGNVLNAPYSTPALPLTVKFVITHELMRVSGLAMFAHWSILLLIGVKHVILRAEESELHLLQMMSDLMWTCWAWRCLYPGFHA